MECLKLFLNGKWKESSSGEILEIENPATKELIGKVVAANEKDIDIAVKYAKDAFKEWKDLSIEDRISYIEKMVEYFEMEKDNIAKIVVKELGSVKKITRDLHVEYYIEDAKSYIEEAKKKNIIEEHDGFTVYHEAVGVVACITPWNFPFGQIERKVIPALLMGNTVILKPSQKTPFTSYYFARACEYANLPKGVFQILTGKGSKLGNILASHKDVNMISFTGSTKAGREISKIAADTIKRLSLELGGKSASIILESADYEKAIRGTLNAVFPNSGQACSSATRLLAPRKDKEKIEELVVKVAKEFKYGDPENPENNYGALINQQALDKVKSYIELGKETSRLLYEGEWIEEDGYFVPPHIFTDVDNNSKIAQEEIFGPVECIIFYDTVDEAIEIANDSIYGLHGHVYGDEKEAIEVARQIRTGQVKINGKSGSVKAPFGGFKQSGKGREGGKYTLDDYVELKAIFH